jgi:hypothetical protein
MCLGALDQRARADGAPVAVIFSYVDRSLAGQAVSLDCHYRLPSSQDDVAFS